MEKTLIIMIGAPGAGKTTLGQKISDNYNIPIVSSDAIRKQLYGSESIQGDYDEVFNEVYRQINKYIECGVCIYDATNTRKAWRHAAVARTLPDKVVYIVVNTPIETALKRNANRERQCPEYVIQRMYRQLYEEYPSADECKNLTIFNYKDNTMYDFLKEL